MILALKPSVIYPAHGKVIDDPVKKIAFYISHRNQREKQILGVLKSKPDESMSAMDIVRVVYTVRLKISLILVPKLIKDPSLFQETPKHLHPAAAANVSHHLGKLAREGNVERTNGETFRLASNAKL